MTPSNTALEYTFPKNSKILIVDDTLSIRQEIIEALHRLGYTNIVEANDGVEALNLLKTPRMAFDLVISDQNMPNMTGLEFLSEVRKTSGLASLPFLILTTEGEKETIIVAIKLKVHGYLLKPVDAKALADKLRDVYRRLSKA